MKVMTVPGVQFTGGFPEVNPGVSLNSLKMVTSSDRHMKPAGAADDPERLTGGFAAALNQALGRVEAIDNRAQTLSTQAIYDPDSVDTHTVVIAAEKARFALNLTKTVADGLVRTFRDLTTPR